MRSPNPLRPQIASTHEKGLDQRDSARDRSERTITAGPRRRLSRGDRRCGHVGENHGTRGANEQLLPEGFLQLPELAIDRGLRDVELLARPRHAAFANHHPEMVEVVMVERVHAPTLHPNLPNGRPLIRGLDPIAASSPRLREAAKGSLRQGGHGRKAAGTKGDT
jgi:hypothetical protein